MKGRDNPRGTREEKPKVNKGTMFIQLRIGYLSWTSPDDVEVYKEMTAVFCASGDVRKWKDQLHINVYEL